METLVANIKQYITTIQSPNDSHDQYSIGLIQLNQNQPSMIFHNANPDTQYEIGSLTKAFASYCVGQYVKQGQVSWTDSVYQWIPIQSNLTLLDLVNHQNEYPESVLTQWIDMGIDRDIIYQQLLQLKPQFIKQYQYQNCLYMFLDKIFPTIYADLHQLLDELNMNHTGFYHHNIPNQIDLEMRKTHTFGLAGGMVSTIDNLCKWMTFNLKQIEPIPTDSFYWKGWWTADGKQLSRIHTGGVIGFSSAILLDTQTNLGISIMCNSSCSDFPKQILNYVGQIVLNYGDNFHCNRPLITKTAIKSFNWNGTYTNIILGQAIIKDSLLVINDQFQGHLIYKDDNQCTIDWTWIPGQLYYDEDYLIKTQNGFDYYMSYGSRQPLHFYLKPESINIDKI